MADDVMAERFKRDTAKHRMIVLRDDGLYRHLRFVEHRFCNDAEYRPNSSFYWFDLVTWPGTLVINGDCGSFTFSRITDMFEFFRSRYGINPQYWAEKVQGETKVKSYSEDKFRQLVKEAVTEAEAHYPGVTGAVEEQFFGSLAEWDTGYVEGAQTALRDFAYLPENVLCAQCSEPAEPVVLKKDWGTGSLKCPEGCGTEVKPFDFADAWEWDLADWDWTFLWCCHAIQWGIGQYDKQAVADEPAPATLLSWVREKAASRA
jgi:hypothetical protein